MSDTLDLEELDDLDGALLRADFGRWCETVLAPRGFTPQRHHRLLIEELEKVATGETMRLMVLMPPGSAKSTYATELFSAWLLGRYPRTCVVGASHTQDLAENFSKKVMAVAREFGPEIGYYLQNENMKSWTTTNGGEYKSIGIGGSITGRRADYVIIDDPIKSYEDAQSETYRDIAWNWYGADVRTRAKPGMRVVVIMTRWNEDDLGGRLLKYQTERWRVVKLPAIAEANDPLGREIGEWLWGDDPRWDYAGELRSIKNEFELGGSARTWSSLFQQNPIPAEGSVFKVGQIEVLQTQPDLHGAVIARGWDLAATKKLGTNDPDWTVGVKLARLATGRYVVLDVVRERGGPDDVDRLIKNTADQDGTNVKISIPEDPGQAGKTQALAFVRLLSGHRIETSRETGDKATRAAPAASQVNGGNFAMMDGPWMPAFRGELAGFPAGSKDDQVDALSRAFSIVGLIRGPIRISPETLAKTAQPQAPYKPVSAHRPQRMS